MNDICINFTQSRSSEKVIVNIFFVYELIRYKLFVEGVVCCLLSNISLLALFSNN